MAKNHCIEMHVLVFALFFSHSLFAGGGGGLWAHCVHEGMWWSCLTSTPLIRNVWGAWIPACKRDTMRYDAMRCTDGREVTGNVC